MRLGDTVIDPPVLLAPMAGLTALPVLGLVARFGAGLVVSEMQACRELLADNPAALARADIAAGLAGRPAAGRRRGAAYAALVAEHVEAALCFHGVRVGIRTMRRHLRAYLGALGPGALALRASLIGEDAPARLLAGIAELGRIDADIPLARAV
jgi:tRNA-dihydrouridine synthase